MLPPNRDGERQFIEACREFTTDGRAFALLMAFARSDDDSRRAWALDKIIQYGVGMPAQVKQAPTGKTSEQILIECFAEEQRLISDGAPVDDRCTLVNGGTYRDPSLDRPKPS